MTDTFKKSIKNTVIALLSMIAVFSCVFLFSACKNDVIHGENEAFEQEENIFIKNADELKLFFETGTAKKATLTASVDIKDAMLTLTTARQSVVLDGGGYTLVGNGDCVIRLENNTSLTLDNITVAGGADVVGCMQDASLSGNNTVLKSNNTAIRCNGKLVIGQNSSITAESASGYGITAYSMQIENGSSVSATAEKNAVNIFKKQLVLGENAQLDAITRNDYSAVKCTGTLVLNNGSVFIVKNEGSYHGAQADYIEINGDVTIKAKGGSKGAGMFLFQLEQDYTVKGYCKSELRKENGHGSIEFTEE